jgi:hypothetical protein
MTPDPDLRPFPSVTTSLRFGPKRTPLAPARPLRRGSEGRARPEAPSPSGWPATAQWASPVTFLRVRVPGSHPTDIRRTGLYMGCSRAR